jgi:hypothetical protein
MRSLQAATPQARKLCVAGFGTCSMVAALAELPWHSVMCLLHATQQYRPHLLLTCQGGQQGSANWFLALRLGTALRQVRSGLAPWRRASLSSTCEARWCSQRFWQRVRVS